MELKRQTISVFMLNTEKLTHFLASADSDVFGSLHIRLGLKGKDRKEANLPKWLLCIVLHFALSYCIEKILTKIMFQILLLITQLIKLCS